MTLKLEVGKSYRLRNGEIVTVTEYNPDGFSSFNNIYKYKIGNEEVRGDSLYLENGKFFPETVPYEKDIVEEIQLVAIEEPQEEEGPRVWFIVNELLQNAGGLFTRKEAEKKAKKLTAEYRKPYYICKAVWTTYVSEVGIETFIGKD